MTYSTNNKQRNRRARKLRPYRTDYGDSRSRCAKCGHSVKVDTTTGCQNCRSLRAAWPQWLRTGQPDLAITVTRSVDLGEERIDKVMALIANRLGRFLVGKKLSSLPESAKPTIVLVLERKDGNDHFHGVIKTGHIVGPVATPEALQAHIHRWLRKTGILHKASVDIHSCDDGWIGYITKWLDSETPRHISGSIGPKTPVRRRLQPVVRSTEPLSLPFTLDVIKEQFRHYMESPRRSRASS